MLNPFVSGSRGQATPETEDHQQKYDSPEIHDGHQHRRDQVVGRYVFGITVLTYVITALLHHLKLKFFQCQSLNVKGTWFLT